MAGSRLNFTDQVQVNRLSVSDTNATVTIRHGSIAYTTLTATRTVTLPTAATYPKDLPLVISDESGSCSKTIKILISSSGTDKILGVASINLTRPYQRVVLYSDGSANWTVQGLVDEVISNLLGSGPLADALAAKITASTTFAIGPSTLPAPYLSKIMYGLPPVLDVFTTYRDGVNGDEPLTNQILSDFNACTILGHRPFLVKDGPVKVPPNAYLHGEGGKQDVTFTRSSSYSGDTLQMGTPSAGMGSAKIDNIWFNHPGRFIGAVPAGSSLTNRLTSGQAHIRAYGSQFGSIINCGGWGMPYFIAQMGGYNLTIENLSIIGGVWDRTNTNMQESIAVLATIYDSVHGYPACTHVINPNWVGGNTSAETRAIPLYGKTYNCNERIGPQYGWLHYAGEDCQLLGGFTGGFNRANIGILPGGPAVINGHPAWVQIGLAIRGSYIDESMFAGIEAVRSDISQAVLNDFNLYDCKFNGQLIGAHGICVTAGSSSDYFTITNFDACNNIFAAYQSSAVRLNSIDDGMMSHTRARGYNVAGFDSSKGDPIDYSAAVVVSSSTRYMAVNDLRAGGSPNNLSETNTCQWGYVDTTSNQINRYSRVRAYNLGLANGGPVFTTESASVANDSAP